MSSFSHEALFNLEATDEELLELLRIFFEELEGTGEQFVDMIRVAQPNGLNAHTSRLLDLLMENKFEVNKVVGD